MFVSGARGAVADVPGREIGVGWKRKAVVVAAVTAGVVVGRGLVKRAGRRASGSKRWHVVTVNRPVDEVSSQLPEPLAALAGEIRLVPAPSGRGTELGFRPDESSAEVRGQVRAALRTSRTLLETGEVLHADKPTTTRPTLLSRPLDHLTMHGREEGRL